MSWYDVALAPGVVAASSPYESVRFGVTIDRISVSTASAARLADVLAAIERSTADVVILRYPADRMRWFAALTELDRTAIVADNLVGWELSTGRGRRPPSLPRGLEIVDRVSAAEMDAMVADAFRDYGNHYLADPLFDPALALAGYQEWAGREIASGVVALRGADGSGGSAMLGFLTYGEADGVAEFALGGVVSRAQGVGLYSHLLAGMEDRAASRGIESVVCTTQSRNVRVQRRWADYGFRPVLSVFTVHLLRRGLLEERAETKGERP
jgi:GNAT superfamily N-acetyltransferase